MKRALFSLSVFSLLMGLVAAPAAADHPIPYSHEEVVEDAINPCTGDSHVVHLTFEGYEHNHERNRVLTGAFTSGWTSDGYVLESGREHWNSNAQTNKLVVTFHNTWSNNEGSTFRINGQWLIDWDTFEGRFDARGFCGVRPTVVTSS